MSTSLEKITFINGQQPAINDTNLNALQNNVETAINTAESSLEAQIIPFLVPTGAMMDFAGSTAPTGWLICNGQAVSRTTYADLFAVIGTTYGTGDGSTTFNVPDKRGKVSVGLHNSQAEFNARGKTGGEKTVTLTKNNLPAGTIVNESGTIHIGTESGTILSKATTATAITNLQPYIVTNSIIKY